MDSERKDRDEVQRDTTQPRRDQEHDVGAAGRKVVREQDPETARRPVPGVKHEPEPDAGNIMPAENEPGTL